LAPGIRGNKLKAEVKMKDNTLSVSIDRNLNGRVKRIWTGDTVIDA
jgi:hypothetical protein